MRFRRLTAAVLVMASRAAAQDLAPEMLLLARIKSHMREELSHLPNYTCLETIARFHKEPGHPSKFQGQLEPLDALRLEIVYSNHSEWYGAPGDPNFTADNPFGFIGSGMIGTGAFATILHNVLEGALVTYRGQEDLGGRTAVTYDFRLPDWELEISIPGGFGTVGEEGSFWVDPQSLDLIRLESRAVDIPPYLPLEETSKVVNYARTRIGEHTVLLAQQADLHMLETRGVESYDRIEFTHCRAFSVQSAIRFDLEPQSDTAKPSSLDSPKTLTAAGGPMEAVPALLPVTVQLITAITDNDAVGTLIEAKVSGDVVRKGKIVIPDGSPVRGRIRRLERSGTGKDFIVGLEFTEVQVRGGPLRFCADLLWMDKRPGIRPTLSEQVLVRTGSGYQTGSQTITLPELPGVASFFVHGSTFTVPSGFRTVWRTRGLIR